MLLRRFHIIWIPQRGRLWTSLDCCLGQLHKVMPIVNVVVVFNLYLTLALHVLAMAIKKIDYFLKQIICLFFSKCQCMKQELTDKSQNVMANLSKSTIIISFIDCGSCQKIYISAFLIQI